MSKASWPRSDRGTGYTRLVAPTGTKLIAQNKKAFHDFFIEETLETGIVLTGTEVKSLRDGRANLRDSYAVIREGELWVLGMHISPYAMGNIFNHEPVRERKLLAHKAQIKRLLGKVTATRVHARAHEAVLQGRPREARDRTGEGQDAVRQAAHPREEGGRTRDGAGTARTQPGVGDRIGGGGARVVAHGSGARRAGVAAGLLSDRFGILSSDADASLFAASHLHSGATGFDGAQV